MTIKYLAHASFLIITKAGTRIVTDPVDPSGYPGSLKYMPFNEPADIVTISHDHADHNSTGVIKGSPIIIKGNGKFQANEVDFRGVATYHDQSQGQQRGSNTVFSILADDIKIIHFGDLGHILTSDQAAEIGTADIALVPVGGYFTIDAQQAHKVVEQVDAKIVIPMHYKTPKCEFPIAGVEDFLRGQTNVIHKNSSILEVTKDNIPDERTIVVLDYSL